MLTPVIGAQVQLTTSLDPTLPEVEADPGQIEQVLVNLALNARDAMPRGGTLRLETGTEQVDCRPTCQMPPGALCLSLGLGHRHRHDARGASAHLRAVLHDQGQQRNRPRAARASTASSSRAAVSSGATSEPGRGTTFKIYLPLAADGAATSVSDAEAEPTSQGTERVLVVDDEPGVRRLLTRLLSARGYTVLEADSGAAAVAVMETAAPQVELVVTDIVMPGMSGRRLAAEIERRWPRVRLLFVTGHAQSAHPDGTSSCREFRWSPSRSRRRGWPRSCATSWTARLPRRARTSRGDQGRNPRPGRDSAHRRPPLLHFHPSDGRSMAFR